MFFRELAGQYTEASEAEIKAALDRMMGAQISNVIKTREVEENKLLLEVGNDDLEKELRQCRESHAYAEEARVREAERRAELILELQEARKSRDDRAREASRMHHAMAKANEERRRNIAAIGVLKRTLKVTRCKLTLA